MNLNIKNILAVIKEQEWRKTVNLLTVALGKKGFAINCASIYFIFFFGESNKLCLLDVSCEVYLVNLS